MTLVAMANPSNQDNPPPPLNNNIVLLDVFHDDDRALEDFVVPLLDKFYVSNLRPPITSNNFELKFVMFKCYKL